MAGVEMTHTDAMGILKSLAVGGLIFGGIGWFYNLIMRKLGKERMTDPLADMVLSVYGESITGESHPGIPADMKQIESSDPEVWF